MLTALNRELERLQNETTAARALLEGVRQEVAEAQRYLGSTHVAQLVEVNEQLVVTVLRAQTETDTARSALTEAVEAGERDALTQLPTRSVVLDRLAQAIAFAKRHRSRLAVLFLDIDHFKQINDTFGHAIGDSALQWAAQCFVASVRAQDTVSRHGGDEFVILLPEVVQASDARRVAEKVAATLATSHSIDGHTFNLTTSIGIGICPDDGDDAEALIHHADTAMYQAKKRQPHEASAGYRKAQPGVLPDPAVAASAASQMDLLRQSNEQLVIAALTAQALQAAAEEAYRAQAALLSAHHGGPDPLKLA
jgi:diguanylate cyclase (GGDEF)-like protein